MLTLKTDATDANKLRYPSVKKKKKRKHLHHCVSKWTKNTMHTNRCQVAGHMHESVKHKQLKEKKKKQSKDKNKEFHSKKQIKKNHTHIHTHVCIYIKTHRKGREFGLVSDGAVLLHKAAVWQL